MPHPFELEVEIQSRKLELPGKSYKDWDKPALSSAT